MAKKETIYGRREPRIFTPSRAPLEPRSPETEARTAGYDVIDFANQVLGIRLYPWQEWLLIHALELNPEGGFRFRTILVLVARQNGKTMLSRVIALWFLYVYGYKLILGTAQDLDTAEETWEAAVDFVDPDGDESIPQLAEQVKKIWRVNGKKAILLKNGARYKVKASSKGSGRGLSGDLILLDELREHHDWKAWSAITKTTIARDDALIWCMSNAGDVDSVVLAELRKLAHEALGDPDGIIAGENAVLTFDTTPRTVEVVDGVEEEVEEFDAVDDVETLAIFEWSAPPEAKKTDIQYYSWSNPSVGYHFKFKNLLAAARTDPDDVFRTECLCQWVQSSRIGPFPVGSWEAGVSTDVDIAADSELVWCVDMAHDRSAVYVAVAGFRDDSAPQVEVAAMLPSADFVPQWFEARAGIGKLYPTMQVVAQAKGAPVTSLLDRLGEIEGVEIIPWQGPDLGAACGQFFDAVKASLWGSDTNTEVLFDTDIEPVKVWHRPQPVLDKPAQSAVTKPLGEAWVWDRAKSPYDAAPLMAVTGALWGLMKSAGEDTRSVYEDGGLMFV